MNLNNIVNKNRMCYYFDYIIKLKFLILIIFIWMKNHRTIF